MNAWGERSVRCDHLIDNVAQSFIPIDETPPAGEPPIPPIAG